MAVSSDSPITAAAPPEHAAFRSRGVAAPQIAATDGELLAQFTRQEDPVALDRLIERHSAMVWRVCRSTLRRPQDVEDAFQATFLLLVKNARSIKSSESAAGWLYRVAYRTSLRARKKLAARREEALAVDPHAPSESAFPDLLGKQTTGVLVEELMRLPAKYQTPLVLRYLEGQSRRAIADQTDTTIAAVQGRLARGKQLLRRRLLRRGVSLAAAMGALGLGARGSAAAENAPARVLAETTSNSAALATGGSVAASAGALSLFQEGVRAMLALTIGKPLASVAALAAAALLLMPPGEAGEAQVVDGPSAGALQLEVDLGSHAPAVSGIEGAVELVQATPRAASEEVVLQADRIEVQTRDDRLVQLQAEGKVTVSPPQVPAPAVFVPGPPVPPANERERLARLLALQERLKTLNQSQGKPDLPLGSPASKRLQELTNETNHAIGQITGKRINQELVVLEKELAVLVSPPVERQLSALEEMVRVRERRVEIVHEQVAEGEAELAKAIDSQAALADARAQLAEARGDLREAAAQRKQMVAQAAKLLEADRARAAQREAEKQIAKARLGAERLAAPEVQPPSPPAPPQKPAPPKPAVRVTADQSAPKKNPYSGVMSAADAAKLRAVRDDLVFEELDLRARNGEPLVRITEMVAPEIRDARQREGKRIEMNALVARTREHEMKLEALLAEMRQRLESTIVEGREEAYLEAMKALRQNEQDLQRLLHDRRSQITPKKPTPPKPPAPEGVVLIAPIADGPGIVYKERNDAYGWSVHQLQERLNELLDPSPALSSDGDYGPLTEAAVKRFQESKGLPSTGFADEATRRALGFMPPRRIVLLPNTDDENSVYADVGRKYGWSVAQLQERLNELLDPSPKLEVDDDYGPLTEDAVRRFQESVGLPATGFADQATRKELGFVRPSEKSRAIEPIKIDKKPSEPESIDPPRWPVIVETVPKRGATDVDPGLAGVRVTFDRDMDMGGYSWTGDKRSFMPERPTGTQPRWIDKRTCVLPVILERGAFYRVGINAKSFQNFKSADGVPAAHDAIAFATLGAKRSIARRARTPKIVEMTPVDGDASVSPGVKMLRVTFDMKMGGGMSWTNTDAGSFPDKGEGRASWSHDGRTCTLPVKLAPGKQYAVGLNASHAVNFQSAYGVPLPPVVWQFTTGEALAAYQYGPDSKMKQGQWNCHHKPTALNPSGWATVALLGEGDHAPIKLPDDARPRPHVKYLGMKGRAAQFEIVDPGHDQHGATWDSAAPTRIRGVPVECRLIERVQPDAPPLLVIRRAPLGEDGEPKPLEEVPTVDEAKELLRANSDALKASRRRESSEDAEARTPPTGVGGSPSASRESEPLLVATRAPGRLDYTDGKADGKKSLGGSGHLIRFELPEGAVGVKSVRVHGSRYGTKTAPREDFEISFLNEDRSEILDVRRGAYGLFRRGDEKWTNVRFKDPVVDLPKTFWVAIDFDPGRTKGVYLSYDTSTGGERSMSGLAQQQPNDHRPVDFGGDWMVSVVLERADAASISSPREATQPVALEISPDVPTPPRSVQSGDGL